MSTTRFLTALLAIFALSCMTTDARRLQVVAPAIPPVHAINPVEPQTVETTPIPAPAAKLPATPAPTGNLATIAAVPSPNGGVTAPNANANAPTPKGKTPGPKGPGGKIAPGGGKQAGGSAVAIRGPKTHLAPKNPGAGGPAVVPRAERKAKAPLGLEIATVGTILRGSSVPGASGDENATGNAILTVYKNGPKVNIRYTVSVRRVSAAGLPTAATINSGSSGTTGPVVIDFAGAEWVNTTGVVRTKAGAVVLASAVAQGSPEAAVAVVADDYLSYATTGVWEDVANIRTPSGAPLSTTFAKVMVNPESFYVVVSTPAYASGAVRGQLRKGTGATVLPPGHRRQWEEKNKKAGKPLGPRN